MNADYIKLAQIAYDTVLQTMIEGEKEHGTDGWKKQKIPVHGTHAIDHIYFHSTGRNEEDHIAHCLTRCAMIKYLENR